MKYKYILTVFCVIQILFACTSKKNQEPKNKFVEDWFGEKVTIPTDIKRVLPIYYVQAEILSAIGSKDKIVGVGRISPSSSVFLNTNFPELLNLPQVGQSNIDYEKIVSLKPDIVFTGTEKPIKDRLATLGLVSVSTYPKSLDDIMKEVLLYGTIMENESRANKIYSYFKALLDSIVNVSKHISYKKRVYYIRTDALTTLGGNVLSEIFNAAGGKLVTTGIGNNSSSLQLSFEDIQRMNPEIIIIRDRASINPEDIYSDKRWSNIEAVKQKKVFQEHTGWTEFRLETIFGLIEKAKWINPELFSGIDCNNAYSRFLNIVKENNE